MAATGSVFTIANGATASNVVQLAVGPGIALVMLHVGSTFDGTTLDIEVGLTDAASDDDIVAPLKDIDGNAFQITAGADTYVKLGPSDLIGVRYMRLVAGTAQTGATTITPIYARVV